VTTNAQANFAPPPPIMQPVSPKDLTPNVKSHPFSTTRFGSRLVLPEYFSHRNSSEKQPPHPLPRPLRYGHLAGTWPPQYYSSDLDVGPFRIPLETPPTATFLLDRSIHSPVEQLLLLSVNECGRPGFFRRRCKFFVYHRTRLRNSD